MTAEWTATDGVSSLIILETPVMFVHSRSMVLPFGIIESPLNVFSLRSLWLLSEPSPVLKLRDEFRIFHDEYFWNESFGAFCKAVAEDLNAAKN